MSECNNQSRELDLDTYNKVFMFISEQDDSVLKYLYNKYYLKNSSLNDSYSDNEILLKIEEFLKSEKINEEDFKNYIFEYFIEYGMCSIKNDVEFIIGLDLELYNCALQFISSLSDDEINALKNHFNNVFPLDINEFNILNNVLLSLTRFINESRYDSDLLYSMVYNTVVISK